MTRYMRPNDLTGERGLLAAVIATATQDATAQNGEHRDDAWRFFAGDLYGHYMQLLELPAEWLPAKLEPERAVDWKEIINEHL